jgi:serine/threonine-protein kinase
LNRFKVEARAAATLRSKHAIQVYDYGTTDEGIPFIVMEMLEGESLAHRLKARGCLSLAETATILGQVGRAIQQAHDNRIVHRDLKPENIFLVHSPDDDTELVKVLDFGIAKMRSGESSYETSSTKEGTLLGTPDYMAPEQVRGLRSVDFRSDLWSLGVIAYRCVVGELPFSGESLADLLVKICIAPTPVPSQVKAGLPPTFDEWFAKCTERDPLARFESVRALTDSLFQVAGVPNAKGQTGALAAYPQGPSSLRASGPGLRNDPPRSTTLQANVLPSEETIALPLGQGFRIRGFGLGLGVLLLLVGSGMAWWRGTADSSPIPTAPASSGASPPVGGSSMLPSPAASVAPAVASPSSLSPSASSPNSAAPSTSAAPFVASTPARPASTASTPTREKPRAPSLSPTTAPGKPKRPRPSRDVADPGF